MLAILLVRAFEDVDRPEAWFPEGARRAATVDALRAAGLDPGETLPPEAVERVLADRARRLLPGLHERLPALAGLRRAARGLGAPLTFLPAVAFVLGLTANLLGTGKRVDLLAAPLYALLAWNLLVYAGTLVPLPARAARAARAGGEWARWTMDAAIGWTRRAVRRALDRDEDAREATRALRRFGADWLAIGGPALRCRVRRALHLAAALAMTGLIAGMYQRGVALAYRATWESTWLGAGQVQTLLDAVLGPAAALLGRSVPDAAPLEFPASGPAGPWIHLFGLTALLFVVLPRGLLALRETARLRRAVRRMRPDWNDPAFRRALAAWRGDACAVRILPYSFEPSPAAQASIQEAFADLFGARVDLRVEPAAAYGDDVRPPAGLEQAGRSVVAALFPLAQTPESEVHGAWLAALRRAAEERGARAVALLDPSGYAERIGGDERRLEQREDAWNLVAREAGVPAVPLDREPLKVRRAERNALVARLDRALGGGESGGGESGSGGRGEGDR